MMKHKPLFVWLVLTLLAFPALTACHSTEDTSPTETTSAEVTIVDARGRTVTFAQPPQRIVIAGRANFMLNDAVYLFPAAPARVVALTRATQHSEIFTSLLDVDYEQKARFTADAGADEIASVQPDVVLLKSFMAESLGAALEQLDIPMVYLDLENPEQYERDLANLGLLFGNPERAATVINFYQTRLERVSTALEGLVEEEKPRVLLLQYVGKGGEVAFKVPPATWIQTQMTELAGGVPIWEEAAPGGGWTVVNLEQIAAWDADQIFIISYFNDVDEVVAQLQADPQWEEFRAVQAGQLYAFPKDFYSWDQPDVRWVLGLTWLAGKIHPARLESVDMLEEVEQFYGNLYNLDAAEVEEKIIPILQGDVR